MEALKHELKKLGALSLFFFICFGYILLILKLFIKDYSVDVYVFTKALIAAIIAAKTVALLDVTLKLDRFRTLPRYVNILYKTGIYTLGALLITFLEAFIEAYRKTKNMSSAMSDFKSTETLSHIFGIILLAAVVFLVHNLWQELDSSFGKGALNKFLFSPPQKPIEKS